MCFEFDAMVPRAKQSFGDTRTAATADMRNARAVSADNGNTVGR
jgi:hypothetical protein